MPGEQKRRPGNPRISYRVFDSAQSITSLAGNDKTSIFTNDNGRGTFPGPFFF